MSRISPLCGKIGIFLTGRPEESGRDIESDKPRTRRATSKTKRTAVTRLTRFSFNGIEPLFDFRFLYLVLHQQHFSESRDLLIVFLDFCVHRLDLYFHSGSAVIQLVRLHTNEERDKKRGEYHGGHEEYLCGHSDKLEKPFSRKFFDLLQINRRSLICIRRR